MDELRTKIWMKNIQKKMLKFGMIMNVLPMTQRSVAQPSVEAHVRDEIKIVLATTHSFYSLHMNTVHSTIIRLHRQCKFIQFFQILLHLHFVIFSYVDMHILHMWWHCITCHNFFRFWSIIFHHHHRWYSQIKTLYLVIV